MKDIKNRLLLLFLLIGLFHSGSTPSTYAAPRYYFKNLDLKNGLSQNTVNAILQDKLGFMWFGTKDGLNRFDGLSFRTFRSRKGDPKSLGSNFITALYEDENGKMWVGTDAGLYIYEPEMEAFRLFDLHDSNGSSVLKPVSMIGGDKNGRIWIAVESHGLYCYDSKIGKVKNHRFSNISSNVTTFNIDKSGRMWIGFFGNGLYYSKDNLKTIKPFSSPDGKIVFRNDVISKVVYSRFNCLYIGSVKGGLNELNLNTGLIRNLLLTDENKEPIYVRDILTFSNSEFWIGTESGVYVYNLNNGNYIHLKNSGNDPYALSDNAVYSLCKDKEQGVWVGSYFGGVNYLPRQNTYFEKYYTTDHVNSIHGKRVRELCQDNDGSIWIGTEDGGLNHFDPVSGKSVFFEPSRAFTNIHGLCIDGDNLWVGTFSKGLKVINKKTGALIKTYLKSDSRNSLYDNSVFSICKTSTGKLYFATLFGLVSYNRETDDFTRIDALSGKFVYDIREDSRGNIWLATYANGAYCLDVKKNTWTNYTYDSKNEKSIPNNKVLSIFEDSRGQIWLTTQGGGFCKFVSDNKSFIRYNSSNGFPSDVVYQIAEDNQGLFWITTNNGLMRFNPNTRKIKIFTTSNGLLSNQFNYRSSLKTDDGTLYFGSIDGFVSFNPSTFSENKYIPPVVITEFLLFNRSVPVGEKHSPIKQSITFSKKLVLKSSQNSFSFRLAALSYQALGMNHLKYKLEGFDKEWYSVTESPLINYSNLKYGKYVFKVRASNNDGVMNEQGCELIIVIKPPFYLTIVAYILYFLLFLATIAYTILYLKRREAGKHQVQMEKFENEKEKEVYKAKIDFFTNVSHEIRTPLTLIKGPLDSIIQKQEVSAEMKEDLNIMSKNTNRLLNLTNQLLDFRKTESQGFQLNFIENNITDLLRDSYQNFSSLARQKKLDFSMNVPDSDLFADVDKEAFIKIISNLFSNAVKYSATYIHVKLQRDDTEGDSTFTLQVCNDGVIIPDVVKERIFQPFVRFNENDARQLTTGTGIGLALSRSLTELHHGRLYMDLVSDCNSFHLTLPVHQENAIILSSDSLDADTDSQPVTTRAVTDVSKPVVLLVDDNQEMLAFVKKELSSRFTILTATNGFKALEILDENYINLIISDVMMPHMDGFEFCSKVKTTLAFSHIPVILLTAKTNLQSKIEGMDLGADAYIEKPFSVDFLQACAANLIRSRVRLREAFTSLPFVASNTLAMTKADEEFLKKINDIIHKNIANSEFSMDEMAEKLNMSRSSFYRKIKEILDLSPNEYLRLERLKKAAGLLKEGQNLVNEICYMVGFNSPSYFSKCFQKQFDVLPKDFASESNK